MSTTQAPGAALASTRDGFLVSGFPGVINVSKKVGAVDTSGYRGGNEDGLVFFVLTPQNDDPARAAALQQS